MTIESGQLEQAFAKVESSYGSIPSPGATDGIRHLALQLTAKNNRIVSNQKRSTPDAVTSLPGRHTAAWNLSAAIWEPSGTLGTASYFAAMLKAAFGTKTAPALAAVVAASPSPTATGVTLDAVTGLAVGDCAFVAVGSNKEITRVKSIATLAVTFDALSAAPSAGATFKSGVNYKLASSLTDSLGLFLFHTAGGFQQAVTGAIVDKVEFKFDGTREVQIMMSGPGRTLVRTGFSQPGSFTTVGSPIGGMVGLFDLDGASFLITDADIKLDNGIGLRNNELGTTLASGFFRTKKRKVDASCSFYLEDTTIIQAAEADGTRNALRLVVGQTAGYMVGVVAPSVEWEIPDVPTTDGPKIIQASGIAYATSGNDELFAAEG